MSRKGWTIIIAMIMGAIIGAVIGYSVGQSALRVVVGAGIGAVGLGLIALVPTQVWEALGNLFENSLVVLGCECCLSFFALSLASIVMLGGLLLWHSLPLAALAGVGVMTVLLVVLSAWARTSAPAANSFVLKRDCHVWAHHPE